MTDDNSRIAFRRSGPIGATGGVPTDFICFELDAATPIVHGYPITEDEALKILNESPVMLTNELQQWQIR